jgi:putative PIN family toxin of toxin-antitoxin system
MMSAPMKQALQHGSLQWIATVAMRDELERVLSYPKIVKSLQQRAIDARQVMTQFDALSRILDAAPKARVTCKDPDDQKFIDLAVAYPATLLSKDKAILCMSKRLQAVGVIVKSAI